MKGFFAKYVFGAGVRAAKRGFTMVELLVVIVILLSLVGLGTLAVSKVMKGSEKAKSDAFAQTLKAAIASYHAENGEFPISGSFNSANFTVGTVSGNRPKEGNAEVIMALLGREPNGKRSGNKRAYITDTSMLYICKGGKRVSKLNDALEDGSISASDMIGFPITMNKTNANAVKALSGARAFAPIKIAFDFELQLATVSVPNSGDFTQVIKLN